MLRSGRRGSLSSLRSGRSARDASINPWHRGKDTSKRPAQRMCPLCLARPADTRGRYAQWARKRNRKLGDYLGGQVPSVLSRMCKSCSSLLGCRYENEAARSLGPMMDGEARLLSPSDQELIGSWVIKTLLVGALDPKVPVPAAQREQIRRLCWEMRDHGTPPHQSFVRLAA